MTKKDPFAALRYPEFVYLISGSSLVTMALLIQEVVLSYELYKLTHNKLVLGLIGLAQALPFISLALFGGHFADRKNKQTIIRLALGVITASSLVLIWATSTQTRSHISQTQMLWIIYGAIIVIGFAKGFYSPAVAALRSFLTPKEAYTNAASWSSSFWQAGAIVGPGSAGFLYAYLGLSNTLWIVVVMLVANMVLVSMISPKPIPTSGSKNDNIWQSIAEGWQFVYQNKIILYFIRSGRCIIWWSSGHFASFCRRYSSCRCRRTRFFEGCSKCWSRYNHFINSLLPTNQYCLA
jgi:MFS family permease